MFSKYLQYANDKSLQFSMNQEEEGLHEFVYFYFKHESQNRTVINKVTRTDNPNLFT